MNERRIIDYDELLDIINKDAEIVELVKQKNKLYLSDNKQPVKLDVKKRYIRAISNPIKDKIDVLNNRIVFIANKLIKQYIKDKI